jgi:hypothetical protein
MNSTQAEYDTIRALAPDVRTFTVIDLISRRAILDALILSTADASAAHNGPMHFVAASDGSISLYTAHTFDIATLVVAKERADALRVMLRAIMPTTYRLDGLASLIPKG